MQKICLIAATVSLASAALLLLPKAITQEPAAPSSSLPQAPSQPTDPKDLLKFAAKANTLDGEQVAPWHMKLTIANFNDSGKQSESESYERYWAGERRNKFSYTGGTSSYTQYSSEKGFLNVGQQTQRPFVPGGAAQVFLHPFPFVLFALWKTDKVELVERHVGAVEMRCLNVQQPKKDSKTDYELKAAVCLDQNAPALRAIGPSSSGVQLYYNNLFLFQGHYVPRDVEGVRKGKSLFTVHVDLLERLGPFDESLIAPPAGVELKPWQPELGSFEDARFEPLDSEHVFTMNPANSSLKPPVLIKRVAAYYSPAARTMRASGEVVVQFTVAKDGTVKNAKALSGHELLRSECVEAVKRWHYAPAQINGEPFEVQMTTTFYFAKPNP